MSNPNLSKRLDEIGLPVRARKALRRLNAETVGDAIRHTSGELLRVRGFGMTTLHKLRRKLADLGLSLADDGPPLIERLRAVVKAAEPFAEFARQLRMLSDSSGEQWPEDGRPLTVVPLGEAEKFEVQKNPTVGDCRRLLEAMGRLDDAGAREGG